MMAWSVDRLGRSLQRLVAMLFDLQAMDIDLYLHQQEIDTTTSAGKGIKKIAYELGIGVSAVQRVLHEQTP